MLIAPATAASAVHLHLDYIVAAKPRFVQAFRVHHDWL